jgi:hypothetical protein
MVYF